MKFFNEIFQDADGGASAKRTAFFLFVALFIGLSLAVIFHGVTPDVTTFAQGALEKTSDIIKWLGGFIVAEKPLRSAALFCQKSSDQ